MLTIRLDNITICQKTVLYFQIVNYDNSKTANIVTYPLMGYVVSYLYKFDTNNWSAVYKHTVGNDYKFKGGYDAEVRLGWISLWVSFLFIY